MLDSDPKMSVLGHFQRYRLEKRFRNLRRVILEMAQARCNDLGSTTFESKKRMGSSPVHSASSTLGKKPTKTTATSDESVVRREGHGEYVKKGRCSPTISGTRARYPQRKLTSGITTMSPVENSVRHQSQLEQRKVRWRRDNLACCQGSPVTPINEIAKPFGVEKNEPDKEVLVANDNDNSRAVKSASNLISRSKLAASMGDNVKEEESISRCRSCMEGDGRFAGTGNDNIAQWQDNGDNCGARNQRVGWFQSDPRDACRCAFDRELVGADHKLSKLNPSLLKSTAIGSTDAIDANTDREVKFMPSGTGTPYQSQRDNSTPSCVENMSQENIAGLNKVPVACYGCCSTRRDESKESTSPQRGASAREASWKNTSREVLSVGDPTPTDEWYSRRAEVSNTEVKQPPQRNDDPLVTDAEQKEEQGAKLLCESGRRKQREELTGSHVCKSRYQGENQIRIDTDDLCHDIPTTQPDSSEDEEIWHRRGRALWSVHTEPISRALSIDGRMQQANSGNGGNTSIVASNGTMHYHGLYARSLKANGIDPVAFGQCRCVTCSRCARRVTVIARNVNDRARPCNAHEDSISNPSERERNKVDVSRVHVPADRLPNQREAGRVLDSLNQRAVLMGTAPATSLRTKTAWMESPGDPQYK